MARLASKLLEGFDADQPCADDEVDGGQDSCPSTRFGIRDEEFLLDCVLQAVEDAEENPFCSCCRLSFIEVEAGGGVDGAEGGDRSLEK